MAAISGKDGRILVAGTGVAHCTKWSFNPKSNNPAWASCDTNGFKTRVGGVKDGSGSMEGKFDTAHPFYDAMDVGTEITALLYINATMFYSIPAIIDDYSIEVDMNEGEVVGWSANFSTRGAWTEPS